MKSSNIYMRFLLELLLISLCIINSICGRRFPEGFYSPGYYDGQMQYAQIKSALEKLEHAPQQVTDWPNPSVKMGQVSAVALNAAGQVLVFHRATNKWDANTFTENNVYTRIGEHPIPKPTIYVFNDTGELIDQWGENFFYMPHGITVDREGNVWVTDVALHQVFKFLPNQRHKPALTLGEKFVPGNDEAHFCKPSAVAVLSTGDFFVADGYCNHRIIKYAPDGTNILQWGLGNGASPFVFNVPHALTLAEDRGQVCVADRERGRVACFKADTGAYVNSFSSWLSGTRLFSVAYAPVHGGRLYIVNGPNMAGVPVRGYVIDFTSGKLIQTFAPEEGFSNPHDIVTSPDGYKVYVAELDPHRVYKFTDELLKNESKVQKNVTLHVKPTATVELSVTHRPDASVDVGGEVADRWQGWRGAAAGAGGAAVAALLVLAALALLRARNRGKEVEAEPLM